MLGDALNERAVCTLLECNLVLRYILGLTSSDDDYVPPNPEDELQLLAKLKSEGADTEVNKFMLIKPCSYVASVFVFASNIKNGLYGNTWWVPT